MAEKAAFGQKKVFWPKYGFGQNFGFLGGTCFGFGALAEILLCLSTKVGTEAAFHGVEEYMKHVAEYFQELEVRQGYPVETKRVYVATDEPKVLAECRRKFPEYTFLGDVAISKSASVSNRYNANSLRGIIVDIYMLSLTDYIVGTFSSQVRNFGTG